jgi:hypothetical protein
LYDLVEAVIRSIRTACKESGGESHVQ